MPQGTATTGSTLRKAAPAALLLLLFVGIAVAGIWLKFDRPVESKHNVGVLETLHQVQGNTGSNFSMFYVRLADGRLVSVVAPEMAPFLAGKRVRLIETTTGLGRVSYSFGGYIEAASNSTAGTDARKSGARGSP